MECGVQLFAERGYQATTVGDIEAAAGLEPRRGAMYRHFPSKLALLEAAVARRLESTERGLHAVDAAARTEPVDALTELGWWFLAELDAAHDLFRILEQDGERLPEVRDVVRTRIINEGHARVGALLQSRIGDRGVDTDALAALVIGPLANHRRTAWTFGEAPLAMTDERLLAAWRDTIETVVAHARSAAAAPKRSSRAARSRRT